MREEYDSTPLRKRDLKDCPLEQFSLWLEEAVGAGIPDSNACSLASVDDDSRPVARAVLLKGLEDGCFVFYTNFNSRKAVQLRKSPWASMHFPWFSMQRQVVVTGKVIPLDDSTSEEYFRSRPFSASSGHGRRNRATIWIRGRLWKRPLSRLVKNMAKTLPNHRIGVAWP